MKPWQQLVDLLVRRLFWAVVFAACLLMFKYAIDIHNGLEAARIYCDCKPTQFHQVVE